MGNSHDGLFKRAFSEVENAVGEFHAVLPPELVAQIDFGTLQLEHGSFVDDALRERHADLLYSAKLAGREAYFYLLFEHQSTVDPMLAYRLLVYVCRIWESWLREHPDARALLAVIPIVLHQGPTGWTAATDVQAIIDMPEGLRPVVHRHLPSMTFLLDDLSTHSRSALLPRDDGVRSSGLFCLRTAPGGREALEGDLSLHLFGLRGRPPDFIEAMLAEDIGENAREAGVTLYESIRGKGRVEGLVQGLEQGREEASRAMLIRWLTGKFGPLPQDALERIQSASLAELESWAGRAAVAASLEALWGASPR